MTGSDFIAGAIGSTSQTEATDQFPVSALVDVLQVVEQFPPMVDHAEKTTARMVVFLMLTEMRGELINSCRKKCDLHLRRTGVSRIASVFRNDRSLVFRTERHSVNLQARLRAIPTTAF